MEYLRFMRLVHNCLFVWQFKVTILSENRVLHLNAHQFRKSEYFFTILDTSLGNLINIRKKCVLFFQVLISIFRISCRGRPSKIFFFSDTAILSRHFVFLNKIFFYKVNILVKKLYKC